MKNCFKVIFVYIGLIIGAGFASGREILEYFNMAERRNPLPVILAAVLFALTAYLILYKSNKLGLSDFDTFVQSQAGRFSPFVKLIMYLFMFCGFFVMLSAGGTLFSSVFSLSGRIGVFILALICFAVFSFDIQGIVAINTVLVPFMIFGIAYLSVSTLLYSTAPVSSFSFSQNPYINAVCYVSYNTITAGSVLVPLSTLLNKKSIIKGVLIGSFILGALIFLIRGAINLLYDRVILSEMPLFDMAVMRGEIHRIIYALVLFTSICTTAVSHGFGILSRFRLKTRKSRIIASAIFCLTALPFSDLNFSFLVSFLYSVFGYFGLIWLLILIIKK